MLASYQLDRARRNLNGYAVLSSPPALGVRTLRGLGAAVVPISSADALQQAIKLYSRFNLNPAQFQNQSWLSQAQASIESASISVTGGFGPDCSGIQAQPLNLFSTVSGVALGTTSAGVGILAATHTLIPATAVPVIGWVIAGVGAIVGLIGMIFAHHAAAVKRDLNFGCSAIPAVNNAFAVIAQGVQSGQIKPADAAVALPQIYAEYMKAGGAGGSVSGGPSGIASSGQPINDHPWCNSNCELSVVLLAMILFWQAQYAAMAAQPAAAAATSPAPGAIISQPSAAVSSAPTGSVLVMPAAAKSAPGSIPGWAFLAAAAAIGMIAAEVL